MQKFSYLDICVLCESMRTHTIDNNNWISRINFFLVFFYVFNLFQQKNHKKKFVPCIPKKQKLLACCCFRFINFLHTECVIVVQKLTTITEWIYRKYYIRAPHFMMIVQYFIFFLVHIQQTQTKHIWRLLFFVNTL